MQHLHTVYIDLFTCYDRNSYITWVATKHEKPLRVCVYPNTRKVAHRLMVPLQLK